MLRGKQASVRVLPSNGYVASYVGAPNAWCVHVRGPDWLLPPPLLLWVWQRRLTEEREEEEEEVIRPLSLFRSLKNRGYGAGRRRGECLFDTFFRENT